MNTSGHPPQDLNWLVTDFIERVPDAAHAVIVSSDGLLVAVSGRRAVARRGPGAGPAV